MSRGDRRRDVAAGAAVAAVAFLPFLRGALAARSFYFRDLSLHFFPVRRFVVEGLRQGALRYWNPFTHEGVALALPPVGYPLDLLQALLPNEQGFSLLLALHVPLAAAAMFALLRHLAVARPGAAAGALVYALGGFTLSTLNLYVYLQAVAWAPLVVWGLLRAAPGAARDVARAAVLVAIGLSTTGVEMVGQALLVGAVLARPRSRASCGRLALAVALGVLLAGPVLQPVAAIVGGSARGAGLPAEVTVAHSVHPVTLLQALVGSLYGDLSRFADEWWGQNFFPRGFPYFLSLYLGAAVVALAASGLVARPYPGRLLAALGVAALVVALGQFVGLGLLVERLAVLRHFRYPSKAFFTVHLAAAMLCAFAVHELAEEPHKARRTAWLAGAVGAVLLAATAAAALLPSLHRYLVAGFFPAHVAWTLREAHARAITGDAVQGGVVAMIVAAVAALAAARRLPAVRAAVFVAGLVAADLLRTGSGLNPMVTASFFEPSPDAVATAAALRASGGRLFTLDAGYDPRYYAARAARGSNHEVWTFAVMQETFIPEFNLRLGVPTAYSLDRTMLVPEERVLDPAEAGAAALPGLIARLRAAAVSHVMAIGPLDDPALEPVRVSTPERVAPLGVHLYRLRGAKPRWEVLGPGRLLSVGGDTDHVEAVAESTAGAEIALRDALGRGWTASIDGRAVVLNPFEGRYHTAALPAGRHVLRLDYHPPGLARGLWMAAVGGLAVFGLAAWGRRRAAPA